MVDPVLRPMKDSVATGGACRRRPAAIKFAAAWLSTVAAWTATAAGIAIAADGDAILVKPSPVRTAAAPTHRVREGGQVRDLWLDPTREAVGAASREGVPGAMTLRPRTAPVGRDSRPPVETPAAKAGTTATTAGSNGAGASPVFVDAAGNPRALPGGVIVTFREAIDDARAREAIEASGQVPSHRLGPRMWLVKSPSGTGALETSESLAATGRFDSVEPNWWRPATLK